MIYAVPLIYPSQISYMNHTRDMTYVPEIYFNMNEGFGVFNFGIGERAKLPCGKSQFLNDLLLPEHNITHSPFSTDDSSAFASGHVDVFFDKHYDTPKKFVIMDGQGNLTEETIRNCLKLTNIVLLHVSKADI